MANALFRAACVCWCHMHMQSPRTLVDLDWDAMETEEHGWMGVCADASGTTVGWEAQLKQSSRHLHMVCQQTSRSVLTAAADAWGAATEYKWRLNNEIGWCCLIRWLLESGYNFRRICLHRLCSFFTQIWFGFKSWSLGALIVQMMKSDIFNPILLWISNQSHFFLS